MKSTIARRPESSAGIDRRRWQAVMDKSALADDPFVYAVRTTGIFCWPDCGSRRPNIVNVCFFDTPAEAAAAGFRPCKRCRPDREPPADRTGMMTHACRRLESEEPEPTLAGLAERAPHLIAADVARDTKKVTSTEDFTRSVEGLKAFADARRGFLLKAPRN